MAKALTVFVFAVFLVGGPARRLRIDFSDRGRSHSSKGFEANSTDFEATNYATQKAGLNVVRKSKKRISKQRASPFRTRSGKKKLEVVSDETPECLAQMQTFADDCEATIRNPDMHPQSRRLMNNVSNMAATLCSPASWPQKTDDVKQGIDFSLLARSLFSFQAECEQAAYKAIQPSLWTGAMIKAKGFAEFLRENFNFRLLHHGSARFFQGSIFGASITVADYFSKCARSFQDNAWRFGSEVYATYYGGFFELWSKRCGNPEGRQFNPISIHQPEFGMVVFIGHTFGLKRPGQDTILFKYELPSVLASLRQHLLDRDFRWDGLAFLNFSPHSCGDVYKTSIGGQATTAEISLKAKLLDIHSSLKAEQDKLGETNPFAAFRWVALGFRMSDICVKCEVVDRSAGPSHDEIQTCLSLAQRRKKHNDRYSVVSDAFSSDDEGVESWQSLLR